MMSKLGYALPGFKLVGKSVCKFLLKMLENCQNIVKFVVLFILHILLMQMYQ